jgi:MftR C-terminal domain
VSSTPPVHIRLGVARACINLWSSHPTPLCRYLETGHQWEQVLAEFFAALRGVSPESDLTNRLHESTLVGTVRAVMRAYARPDTDPQAAIREAFAPLESGPQLGADAG